MMMDLNHVFSLIKSLQSFFQSVKAAELLNNGNQVKTFDAKHQWNALVAFHIRKKIAQV